MGRQEQCGQDPDWAGVTRQVLAIWFLAEAMKGNLPSRERRQGWGKAAWNTRRGYWRVGDGQSRHGRLLPGGGEREEDPNWNPAKGRMSCRVVSTLTVTLVNTNYPGTEESCE